MYTIDFTTFVYYYKITIVLNVNNIMKSTNII